MTKTSLVSLLALSSMVSLSSAALFIDFNSTTQDGGPHNDAAGGYQAYDNAHENAAGFDLKNYSATFAQTGAATVGVAPSWPNTTDNRVQQMIDRGAANDANYSAPGAYSLDLVTDWIGIDARTGSGGNGIFDGTTGTATWLDISLTGLPAATYDWLSIHHDTENVFTNYNVYVDGVLAGSGYQNDSTPGGNPSSGTESAGPANTFSTSFSADGTSPVVIRFEPLTGELNSNVHNNLFALNGFQLTQQVPEPSAGLLGLLGAALIGLRRRR